MTDVDRLLDEAERTVKYLRAADYCERYAVSRPTLRKLIDGGYVDVYRVGRWLLRVRDREPRPVPRFSPSNTSQNSGNLSSTP